MICGQIMTFGFRGSLIRGPLYLMLLEAFLRDNTILNKLSRISMFGKKEKGCEWCVTKS